MDSLAPNPSDSDERFLFAGPVRADRLAVDIRETATDACRLCDGETTLKFASKVLGRYDIRYFECMNCGSLQTETPFWLSESYAQSNLSSLDTGAAQRNLSNFVATYIVAKTLGLQTVLDFGGGDGLLCRLLRDYGLDCYVADKYSSPRYAQGYSEPSFNAPDLMTAFEVLEHFADPRIELDALFSRNPKVLLASTGIYERQPRDWWYLSPESGQHVFFYSLDALTYVAGRYGYRLNRCGGYVLFTKDGASFGNSLIRFLLHRRISRVLRILLALLPPKGVAIDHQTQVVLSRGTQK